MCQYRIHYWKDGQETTETHTDISGVAILVDALKKRGYNVSVSRKTWRPCTDFVDRLVVRMNEGE